MMDDTAVKNLEIPDPSRASSASPQKDISSSQRIGKVLMSGAGFAADSYDLFVINVVVDIASKVNYKESLSVDLKSLVKTTALIGAMFGQIIFGSIADLIGRKVIFICTCLFVIVGALLSATVVDSGSVGGIYTQLCIWRFLIGFGIGGEYPLSASITSESSSSKYRVQNLGLVFSMQGIGAVLCSIVLVIVTLTLGSNYNAMWRIALGLGGLPMAIAFNFRWKMHETSWKQETLIMKNQQEQHLQYSTQEEFSYVKYCQDGFTYLGQAIHVNGWKLLGTSVAWFILDIVFYANGLFSGQVTTAMGYSSSPTSEAIAALILQAIALPGYYCTVFFADYIGLNNLQMIGFTGTAFFFALLAILLPYLKGIPGLYLFIYGLTFFFQNFGANATTYIIPSIIFPTVHRATCHGISAAAGKLGAILGAQTLLYLVGSFSLHDNYNGDDVSISEYQADSGLRVTFAVCSFLAILGLVWSYFMINDEPAQYLLSSSSSSSSPTHDSSDDTNTNISTVSAVENPLSKTSFEDDHNNETKEELNKQKKGEQKVEGQQKEEGERSRTATTATAIKGAAADELV